MKKATSLLARSRIAIAVPAAPEIVAYERVA